MRSQRRPSRLSAWRRRPSRTKPHFSYERMARGLYSNTFSTHASRLTLHFPLFSQDTHEHIVQPPAVVARRMPGAALDDEAGFFVRADGAGVGRQHAQRDTAQAHLPEAVTHNQTYRVRTVAFAPVVPLADVDAEPGVLVRPAIHPQPDLADEPILRQRSDGELEAGRRWLFLQVFPDSLRRARQRRSRRDQAPVLGVARPARDDLGVALRVDCRQPHQFAAEKPYVH